jgi:hypothetical protein
MDGAQAADERSLIRLGGFAGLGMSVLMVLGYGIYFSLSSVQDPRVEPAAYLDDIAVHRRLLGLVGWMLGTQAVLIVPWVLALYYRLRGRREPWARLALVFGLAAPLIELLYVATATAIDGHLIPAWQTVPDTAGRAALLSDFLLLEWLFMVFVAAFDVAISVLQVIFGLAMLRQHTTAWVTLGWVTLASAALNFIGVFSLAAQPLSLVGLAGLLLGWVFVLGSSALLVTQPSTRAQPLPAAA